MSEEKLYAVKNDEGKYWDFSDNDIFWSLPATRCPTISGRSLATSTANKHGGHVVTFVEEPKKVVLSKTDALRQGWLVARYGRYNPDAVSDILAKYKDEAWGMIDAYVNGYTVAKEKKYNVKVPQTQTSYYYKGSDGHVHASDTSGGLDNEFSDYELQQYGLDGKRFTKEEVTDDDND
ncbi:DUF1642 domain-containing protein [Lactobacillus paracasei]|uniref:DUF1642 domain-containing protein n=1 Tax=Lacticaseibacillus paracasei TaxID=1597 RepID=UPI00136EF5D4|nr:DUF1642 domain-containing protein [Lacticaseibacillus paracasei]MXI85081.1 DUF1642 domain-containing protein [Lacticaseibacillus paracasei]